MARRLALGLIFLTPVTLFARTIRVPSLDTYKFLSNDSSRSMKLYYSEYLTLLAQTSGWEYDFVDFGYVATATEMNSLSLQFLREGKLDLAFDITEQDPSARLFYSSIPALTKHIMLVESYKESSFNSARGYRTGATEYRTTTACTPRASSRSATGSASRSLRQAYAPPGKISASGLLRSGSTALLSVR